MPDAPVRVVHVITRMILGGAQESTLALCDGLCRRPDWDLTLITGPPIGPRPPAQGRSPLRMSPRHGHDVVMVQIASQSWPRTW